LLIFLAASAFFHPNDAASDLVIAPHAALRQLAHFRIISGPKYLEDSENKKN